MEASRMQKLVHLWLGEWRSCKDCYLTMYFLSYHSAVGYETASGVYPDTPEEWTDRHVWQFCKHEREDVKKHPERYPN